MDRNISYQRSVRLRRRQLPDFWDNFRRGFLRSSLHWRGSTTTSFWSPLLRGRVLPQAETEGKRGRMSLQPFSKRVNSPREEPSAFSQYKRLRTLRVSTRGTILFENCCRGHA